MREEFAELAVTAANAIRGTIHLPTDHASGTAAANCPISMAVEQILSAPQDIRDHISNGSKYNDFPATLLLDGFPAIHVLPTHLSEDEIHELEELLVEAGARLAYDVRDARLVLSAVNASRRVKFELQARGIELSLFNVQPQVKDSKNASESGQRLTKRRRTGNDEHNSTQSTNTTFEATIKVVRSDWLVDSAQAGKPLDDSGYLIYKGEAIITSASTPATISAGSGSQLSHPPSQSRSLRRTLGHRQSRHGGRDRNAAAATKELAGRSFMPSSQPAVGMKRRLLHETTTEHDEAIALPDLPEWVRKKTVYACERAAPLRHPNEAFIEVLQKIRLARILIGDEIGVRAYSTSIASIVSYPYVLSSVKEVLILPGCEEKVGQLMLEFLDSGHCQAADEVDTDSVLSVLSSFYKIWGVGATTARSWYYERGWRDHDDVVEYGWNELSRNQQIGLKYFDEFEQKLSRSETENIASTIRSAAAKVLNDDEVQSIIVGGYRRGKQQSGDVDVIITHKAEENTKFLIAKLVRALEASEHITHTLIISEANSARDQEAIPVKSGVHKGGFDTLDKALVVWQDPDWKTREDDMAAKPKAKNPNIHRRVDIIVSPWRTIGTAICSWTCGTTFNRDLRRYSRRKNGWKFDSSGVRDLASGKWIDLEEWQENPAPDWLEAERRVFRSLGLTWRDPEDRNTF